MEIVLATRNKRKVEGIKRVIGDIPVSIMTIDDFPGCPEVEEEGVTFQENAAKRPLLWLNIPGNPLWQMTQDSRYMH